MSGDLSSPTILTETQEEQLKPKVWGRRIYAGKAAREVLNDASRAIAEQPPNHVDDPTDPSLADVLQQAGQGIEPRLKGQPLADLIQEGLSSGEAVCWYWYRHAQFDVTEIYFAR